MDNKFWYLWDVWWKTSHLGNPLSGGWMEWPNYIVDGLLVMNAEMKRIMNGNGS